MRDWMRSGEGSPGPAAGDPAAMGLLAIFEAERARLLRFVIARFGDASEADDVLQEMWLKLSRAGSGPVAHPSAYLFRMASNLMLDRIRQRQRRDRNEQAYIDETCDVSGATMVDTTAPADRVLAERQELERLMRAIDTLPPRAQQIFRRHRIDGIGHALIANELGISRSAVEQSMAVALRHLAIALETGR